VENGFNMDEQSKKTLILVLKIAIPIIIAILSFTLLGNWASNESTYSNVVKSLDEKRDNVIMLTGASFATSAAITVIPGDIGTPIAEKLADLSGYFVLILCVIYLEKYLLTIVGMVAFKALIPLACLIWLLSYKLWGERLKIIAAKLVAFAIAIALIIPLSAFISSKIEQAYDYNKTIDAAARAAEEMTGQAEEEETEEISESDKDSEAETEDMSFWDKIKKTTTDTASDIVDNVKETVSVNYIEIREKLENVLSSMVDAIAILIVTSCVIPVAVLFFFIAIAKLLFGMSPTLSIPIRTLLNLEKDFRTKESS
jgi:hypothetical protein